MKMFIIGLLPYVGLGFICQTLEVSYNDWQFWGLLVCMLASDTITHIKESVGRGDA